MKNKLFLFSLIFVFGLLAYLHYQISLASISSVTTGTPSVGKTSATLNGTVTLGGAGETHARGFALGTATANYDIGTSTELGAGSGSFSHATTTNLSKGTAYYFRAYAASSTAPQTVYGNEAVFLTGIDDPTSLAATAGTVSDITLSWTKGTGAGNTYVMYRTDQYPSSITDGTQGCISSGTSCTVSSLGCSTTYYLRAWSSTTAAGLSTTSDSYAQLTDSTEGCPPPTPSIKACAGPKVSADSLIINKGAKDTPTREVELSIQADSASLMSVCNNSSFINCPLENYKTTKPWTLTEGDGPKTVYAVFTSSCGMNSAVVSSNTIILQTPTISVPTPTPIPLPVTPAPEITPTPSSTPAPAPGEKPVTSSGAISGCTIISFNRSFRMGMSGNDVKCLQIILNSDPATKVAISGAGSPGNETNYFGVLTKAAVIKFQEKYASEILAAFNITKGTGVVATNTRAKLNELLGK